MNPGDMGQDVSRSGSDEASSFGAVGGPGNTTLAESPRVQETLQDIQDIIDKLEAITRQLRRAGQSGSGGAGPVEPGGEG